MRNAAANALADLKDQTVAPALLAALAEDDSFVLTAVLRALKPMRIKDARVYAIGLLQHADAGVRREAVGVLGYLQEAENLPQLMAVAANDEDSEVRRTAVGSLVFATPSQVSHALISALGDVNWQVLVEAIKGIGRLKITDAIDQLIEKTSDERWQVKEKAAETIGKLGMAEGIPALGLCINDPISNLRKAAVAALGEISHPDGLKFVTIALDDNDPDVRKLARWAQEKIETAALAVSED